MSKREIKIIFTMLLLPVVLQAELITIKPEFKQHGLLRNPGMGWVLYDDGAGEVADADEYWAQQDAIARSSASIFYLRWRWSDVEKREGVYEWDDPNSNFSRLIRGATERGLRLAFRFYVNPSDNLRQSTPQWVQKACRDKNGQWIGDKWSPFLDDRTFQKKFAQFIAAFGKKFDDPAIVEWIDVSSVGRWGEAHGLVLQDQNNKLKVYKWLLETYADNFKNVLLGMQYGTEFGVDADTKLALEKYDCVLRRDGFGSQWIMGQIDAMKSRFPRNAIFAEKCYWNNNEAWRNDRDFKNQMNSWADVHRITLEQALDCHANTLDLRTVWDAREWAKTPALVEQFIEQGGYRIALASVTLSSVIQRSRPWEVKHTWANHGVGILPNHNQRWGNKYKVAFGLFDPDTGKYFASWLDPSAEPGDWVKGKEYAHVLKISGMETAKIPPGKYQLIAAILNTKKDGAPNLQLAIECKSNAQQAYLLTEITVE